MKYLPLVWGAFRRHTTESLLKFLVLTVAFTLFSSMVALKAAYDHAINVNRMDRLLVTPRFSGPGGLNIARRDEIARIPGVRGVAAPQSVQGRFPRPARFEPCEADGIYSGCVRIRIRSLTIASSGMS